MNYFIVICQIIVSLLLLFSFYFICYLPFSFRKTRTIKSKSSKLYEFAVLIPAKNEENSIARTIESLRTLDYPQKLLKIFFILDNSDDRTKEIILNADMENIVCCEKNDNVSGKAKALNWFFKEYRNEITRVDAITIFDADNKIDEKFFLRMVERLNTGERIIQANARAIKIEGDAFSAINFLNIEVVNFLREQCKSKAGLSCRLRGHGMCFRVDLLDEIVFDNESITEDAQLTIDLIMKGYKAVWAQECIVYSGFPDEIEKLTRQRLRWTRGRVDIYKKNVLKILMRLFEKRDWSSVDLFFELLLQPLSLLISMNVITCLAAMILNMEVFLYFSGSYLCVIGCIYSYFLIKNKIALKHILVVPYLLVWRNVTSIRSLLNRNVKW